MSNITDRMKTLVNFKTTELKKYKEMEELTRITAASWRSWWNRNGPPSGEMIEAVCAIWPDYAFWLATGIPDFEHGHNSPLPAKRHRIRTAARDLFLKKLEEQAWLKSHPWTAEEDAQFHAALNERLTAKTGDIVRCTVDPEVERKIHHWHCILGEISELERIRQSQEDTLEQFENDEPLPF